MPRGALLLLLAASAAERDCRGELCGLRPYLWTMMASTPTTLSFADESAKKRPPGFNRSGADLQDDVGM